MDCPDLALSEQGEPERQGVMCVYNPPGSTKRSPFLALGDVRKSGVCVVPHLTEQTQTLLQQQFLLLTLATHSILPTWGFLYKKWYTAFTFPLVFSFLRNCQIMPWPSWASLFLERVHLSPDPGHQHICGWSQKGIKVDLRCCHKAFEINHFPILSVLQPLFLTH